MRSSTLLLLCALVAAVWAAGCSSAPGTGGAGTTTVPQTLQTSPVPSPVTTTGQSDITPLPQTYPVTMNGAGAMPSREDIARHLMDIAYGDTNDRIVNIYRWSERLWLALDGKYTEKDIEALIGEATTLNSLVQGFTISEDRRDINFRTDENAIVRFDILPTRDMEEIFKHWKYSVDMYQSTRNPADGTLSMMVVGNHVYVNSDLPGESREYYLKRGLLITLGFPGRTDRYNESFFASGRTTDTGLTTIDREAVSLLYAGKIRNGMKPDEVRELLMLPKRE